MGLIDSLTALAEQTYSGSAFLIAYGTTWLICGVTWLRASPRTAAYVTLFQGTVAFPVALGLSVMIGALGQVRPIPDEINQLSILMGTSQMIGLPFFIYLVVKHQYRLLPFANAIIVAMHFVMYSWLYRTPLYIVMAVVISLVTMIIMVTSAPEPERKAPARTCLATGACLLVTASVFLAIHW